MSGLSKHERQIRVELVRRLLITGNTKEEVVRICSDKFRCTERATENYIHDARESINRILDRDARELLAEQIAHRELLRKVAHDAKQYSIELSAAQDEAKLLNLYNTTQTLITLDMQAINSMNKEQLKRVMNGESIASVLATPTKPS